MKIKIDLTNILIGRKSVNEVDREHFQKCLDSLHKNKQKNKQK